MQQGILSLAGWLLLSGVTGVFYAKTTRGGIVRKEKPFGLTLTLAAVILLIMTGIYGIQGKPFLLLPAATACAFLLPTLARKTWQAYSEVPEKEFPVWFCAMEDLVPADGRSDASVDMRFNVSADKGQDMMLFTSVPRNEPLGSGFVSALLRHNEKFPGTAIAVTDGQGFPYGWQFFSIRLQGAKKKFIDPNILPGTPDLKNRSQLLAKRCYSQRPVVYRMKAR